MMWSYHHKGALTAELFVTLLRRMMAGWDKPVHLVVDGLPAHRTRRAMDDVASTKGMLTPHILPGDAPDLNPDALVRRQVKRNRVAGTPLRKGETHEAKIENQPEAVKPLPSLVRSFFKAPSVAYATDCRVRVQDAS